VTAYVNRYETDASDSVPIDGVLILILLLGQSSHFTFIKEEEI